MITSLKNSNGYIYALIEWEQIDSHKILIKYTWVHENYRSNGCIPEMVYMMAMDKSTHETQFVGWERGEEKKKFKWYPTYRILRRFRNGRH